MLKKSRFSRKVEDFICFKCGIFVAGNGYTDHCPNCLWGKHVDVNPGDRAADCGGTMKPFHVGKKRDEFIIEYVCEKCGYKFRVKAAKNDNFEELLNLNQA